MALLDDILAGLSDEEPKKKKVVAEDPEKEDEPQEKENERDRMDFKDDDPGMPPKGLKNDKEPGSIQFCKAFLEEFGDR